LRIPADLEENKQDLEYILEPLGVVEAERIMYLIQVNRVLASAGHCGPGGKRGHNIQKGNNILCFSGTKKKVLRGWVV